MQAFAFCELVYISQRFQERRKAIFKDIDRKGGSTWSQILAICLETVTGINKRISEYEGTPVTEDVKPVQKKDEPIPALPKIGKPLKDGIKESGDLFSSPPLPTSKRAGVVQAVGTFAKSHGQSPTSSSPKALKLLSKAANANLTPKQEEEVALDGFGALIRDWTIWFLKSNFGWPFRQEYRRKIAMVVLGSPYGDVGIIVDAIDSLTRLAVCSLQEDKYGNVQRDVKKIIQTLTITVTKLEKFKSSLGVHWTDVEKKQESPEVDTILAALKGGLNELIGAFGDYSEDLRLSQNEMRLAREAATPAPRKKEMEEKR
jgi:nucleoporin NDC1